MAKGVRNFTLPIIIIVVILVVLIGIIIFSKKEAKVIEKELPFSVIELGNITIKDPGYYVINNKEELNELLSKSSDSSGSISKLNSNLKFTASSETVIPEIDFDKYTLIAVFMGESPTSGYSITVDKIIEETKVVKIHLTEITPGKNCIVNQVFTYPYQVVEVPKISKDVKYIPDKVIKDCD